MEFTVKLIALQREISALDMSSKEYQNKLRALQMQEQELAQEHEQKLTDIKVQAELQRNRQIEAAESQAMNNTANGLTQSIMGHETWAKMITQFGNQAVEGMIKNSLLILAQQDQQRLGDAKTAASNAYASVSSIPIVGPFLAPAAAAVAFGAVMAFETGTDKVPGVGKGDIVPAMLTPGEGVVEGGVMDGLRKVARNGGFDSQRPTHHVVVHQTLNVHSMDADGVASVLQEHGDQFQQHFEKTLRRMNK